jgi:hypothetical protein
MHKKISHLICAAFLLSTTAMSTTPNEQDVAFILNHPTTFSTYGKACQFLGGTFGSAGDAVRGDGYIAKFMLATANAAQVILQ